MSNQNRNGLGSQHLIALYHARQSQPAFHTYESVASVPFDVPDAVGSGAGAAALACCCFFFFWLFLFVISMWNFVDPRVLSRRAAGAVMMAAFE